MAAQIIPVIMCGGAGTRLWPISRESMPKQFVPFVGPESTFQQVLAGTDPELFASDRAHQGRLSLRGGGAIAELRHRGGHRARADSPRFRSGGQCCRRLVAERDRNAIVLVLTADHVIRNPEAFRDACRSGDGCGRGADSHPWHPAHWPGYQLRLRQARREAQRRIRARSRGLCREARCRDRRDFVADHYLWNSGNFLFHAATMLSEIERFEPVMAEAAKAVVAGLTSRSRFHPPCGRALCTRTDEVD